MTQDATCTTRANIQPRGLHGSAPPLGSKSKGCEKGQNQRQPPSLGQLTVEWQCTLGVCLPCSNYCKAHQACFAWACRTRGWSKVVESQQSLKAGTGQQQHNITQLHPNYVTSRVLCFDEVKSPSSSFLLEHCIARCSQSN